MFPTSRNPAYSCLLARAPRSTRIPAQHGRTKAIQCDRSGSFHKPAPRLAKSQDSTKAAVPEFSARKQHDARSLLVQQSPLTLPTQKVISVSSSFSFASDVQPIRLAAILRPGGPCEIPSFLVGVNFASCVKVTISTPSVDRSQFTDRRNAATSRNLR